MVTEKHCIGIIPHLIIDDYGATNDPRGLLIPLPTGEQSFPYSSRSCTPEAFDFWGGASVAKFCQSP